VLIDTNIFLRAKEPWSERYSDCSNALQAMRERREVCYTCAQIWIEYWAALTRPRANNGLGFSLEEAVADLNDIRISFPALTGPHDIAEQWRSLVERYGVRGRQVHDARIVA
jgi:Predicted nucleic acid-binding protein, contains PIN domain